MRNLSLISRQCEVSGIGILCVLAGFLFIHLSVGPAYSQAKTAAPPDGTAIPVSFTHTIDARKEKQGNRITAKTMQLVLYGPAESIAKGSLVLGHVVDVSYTGKDGPSTITIKFDRIVDKHRTVPICASVRAMANSIEAYDATAESTSLDSGSPMGTTLVGGDHLWLGGKKIYATDHDIVGIRDRFGIFSRLEPAESNDGTSAACGGIPTLQSVAIFSSRACGLYGFSETQISSAGNTTPRGEIKLESNRYPVEIPSGSAALLQIIRCDESR